MRKQFLKTIFAGAAAAYFLSGVTISALAYRDEYTKSTQVDIKLYKCPKCKKTCTPVQAKLAGMKCSHCKVKLVVGRKQVIKGVVWGCNGHCKMRMNEAAARGYNFWCNHCNRKLEIIK